MFVPLERALEKPLQHSIFCVKQVQEDRIQSNSIPAKMAGLGILQLFREAIINHDTARSIKSHDVAAIMEEEIFDPSTHATTMTSGQVRH